MAIRIPSKNIYGSPQNPKVRDNVIERIEVGAVEVVPDNEYETPVYSENFFVTQNLIEKNTLNREIVGEIITTGADIGINAIWVANAEISNQKILNKTITIPKIKENKWISSLKKGSNQQIKYTVYGNVQEGNCLQRISWAIPDGLLNNPIKPNFTKVEDIVFTPFTNENTGLTFDYYSDIISSYKGTPHSTFNEREISATLKPNNISKVISFQENENEVVISIDIMAAITVSKLGGSSYKEGVNGTVILSGVYEKYIPTEIEITVYGNTIGIDLTEKTVYINGETAKKVHSIDGNELMQTSNYYETFVNPIEVQMGGELSSDIDFSKFELYSSKNLIVGQLLYYENEKAEIVELPEETGDPYKIKVKTNGQWANASGLTITVHSKEINSTINKNYQHLVDIYKNGKETATIRCSISNYKEEGLNAKVVRYDIHEDNTIYCVLDVFNSEIAENLVDFYIYSNGVKGYVADCDETTIFVTFYGIVGNIESGEIKIEFYPIAIDGTTSMCFSIGDEVIPMVYGADGQDHPMSIYLDGTAKVFQVLGSKIYYDGAVWQELSLQEVDKSEVL
jgi:hypothetical protein